VRGIKEGLETDEEGEIPMCLSEKAISKQGGEEGSEGGGRGDTHVTFGEVSHFEEPSAVVLGDVAGFEDGFGQSSFAIEDVNEDVGEYSWRGG
jgi:hypothetical protein